MAGKRWTEEEIKILKDFALTGKKWTDIPLDRKPAAVKSMARFYNLKLVNSTYNNDDTWQPWEEKLAIQGRKNGLSANEIRADYLPWRTGASISTRLTKLKIVKGRKEGTHLIGSNPLLRLVVHMPKKTDADRPFNGTSKVNEINGCLV